MKIQYIIFVLIVIGLIYLVYPNNSSDVEEARDRIIERQNQDNNTDAGVVGDDTDIDNDVDVSDEINNSTGDSEISDTQEREQLPTESLDVQEILDINTPSFVDYGDPVATSDNSFVYNQVRGLEIFREQLEEELSCDDLTDFLTERLRTWYFWNTCRVIDNERWLKFNVIRLQWEEYIYERHYIDRVSSLYAVLELERWTWIENDMLPEKNTELRDAEFPLIEIWDALMRELIRAN